MHVPPPPHCLFSESYDFSDLCNGARALPALPALTLLRSSKAATYHQTAGNLCYEVAYTVCTNL